MIFEDIISGSARFDAATVLTVLFILAVGLLFRMLSAAIQKPFLKNGLSFPKTVFSLYSLFSVISLAFFGAAPLKTKTSDRKKKAKISLTLWLAFAAAGALFIAILFPLTNLRIFLTAGALFIGTATVNLLPLPGFLIFGMLCGILPEKLSGKLEKAEKFSPVFIVFGLLLFARSGAVSAAVNLLL